MTIEDKLKDYILSRYHSVRDFALHADLSNSTVNSILKRGIGNSSVNNIIRICKTLSISVDELAKGNIVPINTVQIDTGLTEVTEILHDVKNQLIQKEGLTLDGKPASKKTIESIVNAMRVGEEIAREK